MNDHIKISKDKSWLPSKRPYYIFGPCSAESPEQLRQTASQIHVNYQDIIFRAGVWKPRTRPDTFEGMGEEALKWLIDIKQEFGFKIATEVANAKHVELCLKAGIDILWIGARTTVNPFSVQAISDALKGEDVPVFVKNPINPDFSLWMGVLERVNKSGISKLGAIHRGFHLADNGPYRNAPQWNLAIQLKAELPNLPLICDVSHISGNRELIPYVAQKAIDLDMDGLLIETHIDPSSALSDAQQQLTPTQLEQTIVGIIPKTTSSSDPEFKNKLELLREEIDSIDDDFIDDLAARMVIARKIGEYKKQNNVTILQVERWQHVVQKCLAQGKALGLSEAFIRDLLNAVHDESIRQQTSSYEGNDTAF